MRVSEYAVRRLSLYHRILRDLEVRGQDVVSSDDLARWGRTNAAQVRKDLSYFGSFGKRGRGYDVPVLRSQIQEILGLHRRWRVVIVGAGRLGSALASYQDFPRLGFEIVAMLDNSPSCIGKTVGGLRVRPVGEMADVVKSGGINLGIVAVPADAAQDVVDMLAGAGVRGILNFAPKKVNVPEDVGLRHVDISIELEGLTFDITSGLLGSNGRQRAPEEP
jgi:redox-sensing transcriptional repressor